jgi:hypothetical protein
MHRIARSMCSGVAIDSQEEQSMTNKLRMLDMASLRSTSTSMLSISPSQARDRALLTHQAAPHSGKPAVVQCERLVIVEVGVDRAVKCYIDTPKLDLIGRMHGSGWYARTTDRFDMPRIDVADWPVRAKAAE